ncbi:MAG TPA: hypothetical protein P5294_06920 [Smithellaceae bacterium]|nr:hypothetical protein [Smithellaceae bacterium]HRS88912.1 hypothetical protein [Smithellaceae bacterium]HRV26251.1 hypothetical protein [Smithellaceae bacterium]
MPGNIIYSDSLVEIKDNSILFRRYSFFERDRIVLISDIEKIVAKKATIWNGKFRFHGTGDFKTWFPKDFRRYKRDRIFVAYLRYKWWRIGFTVEDSEAVTRILRGKGLLKEIF